MLRGRCMAGALVVILGLLALAGAASARTSVPERTPRQVASAIEGSRGNHIVVMLLWCRCPACQKTFPDFAGASGRYAKFPVRFLALAVDDTAEDVAAYLGDTRVPIPFWRLVDWEDGALRRALSRFGVDLGERLRFPTFFILDAKGRKVAQWEGGGAGAVQRITKTLDRLADVH